MRALLLSVFVLVYFTSTAQVYLKLNPTPESSPGACDAAIDVEFVGATPPYEIHWWDNSWQVSNGMRAENLCAGKHYTVTFLDSNCYRSESSIYIHPNPNKQIYPGYITITLPTNSSTCDGGLSFSFHNTSSIYRRDLLGTTQDSVFNSLCESSNLTYTLLDSSLVTQYTAGVSFLVNSPQPCLHFETNIEYTGATPSGSGSDCDASIDVLHNGTGVFDYYIFWHTGGGATQINNTSENFADSVCSGPYIADTYNYSNYFYVRDLFYVPIEGTQDSIFWNFPDSLPTIVDTIVLNALVDCGANVSSGIDTAYISDVYLIGNSQYHFTITAISGTDTINYFNAAIMDTTHGNVIQLVIFCEDTTRALSASVKNNFYFGPILSDPDNVAELWKENIQLYPNPANRTIRLNNLPSGKNNLSIYNLLGESVLNTSSNSEYYEFDIRHLPEGYYLIQISNENNQTATKKFIVIHQN